MALVTNRNHDTISNFGGCKIRICCDSALEFWKKFWNVKGCVEAPGLQSLHFANWEKVSDWSKFFILMLNDVHVFPYYNSRINKKMEISNFDFEIKKRSVVLRVKSNVNNFIYLKRRTANKKEVYTIKIEDFILG